jgi:hypothetical protein
MNSNGSMSNYELLQLLNECVCKYADTNALKSACSCRKSTNELARS